MIAVLTDGNFAKKPGFSTDLSLQKMATTLSNEGVIVFFFVLNTDSSSSGNLTTSITTTDPLQELRKFSCGMNSTVTRVELVDAEWNPLWGIRPYFDYQAGLRHTANSTFWTDTYDDFDGLGLVATVTFPGQCPLQEFLYGCFEEILSPVKEDSECAL